MTTIGPLHSINGRDEQN